MGKKTNGTPRPTASFADLVSQKNRDALKPFIAAEVQALGSRLARQQLAATGDVIAQIAALKKALIDLGVLNDEQFQEARFEVEDDSWGLNRKDAPAEFGDFVRVIYRAKLDSDANFGPEERVNVSELGKEGAMDPQLAEAIKGMKAGEEKDVTLQLSEPRFDPATKTKTEVKTTYQVKVRVARVSSKPKAPEAPKEGVENAQ